MIVRSDLVAWVLAGFLAGSLAFHVVQARRLDERVAPAPAPADPAAVVEPAPVDDEACCGKAGPQGGCGHHLPADERLAALGLSEEQRAALATCCLRVEESEGRLGVEFRTELAVLRTELSRDEPDEAVVDRAVDRLCDLRRRFLEIRVAAVLAIKKTLTPEQIARLTRPDHDIPPQEDNR